jgi:hypothetical protein
MSCLLHTDSDNRTRCFCCARLRLTPEALDVVSGVGGMSRLRVCGLGYSADRLPLQELLGGTTVRADRAFLALPKYVGFF